MRVTATKQSAYLRHLRPCQDGGRTFVASSIGAATPYLTVTIVVGNCADYQVGRLNTCRGVAGMSDDKSSRRTRAMRNLPRHSVRALRTDRRTEMDDAVAIPIFASRPQKTTRRQVSSRHGGELFHR